MQVACPHCTKTFQPDKAGVQFCPHCGGQLEVPASSVEASPPASSAAPMVSPPVPTAGPAGEGTPWERRAQIGVGPALLETVKQVLLTPQAFWDTVDPNRSMTDALWYAWIIGAVAGVVRIPFMFANRGALNGLIEQINSAPNLPQESKQLIAQYIGMASGANVGAAVIGILAVPISLIIYAGILHVCGLITGAAGQGYGATFRVICYASTPTLFGFHSCTAIFASIYQLILIVMGLRAIHRTTTGKAAAAVLAPAILLCVCCCAVAMMAGFAGAMASRGGD